MVVFVELLFTEIQRIVGVLPCIEAELYFQGEPGPRPEFTESGMNGLYQVIHLHVYEGQIVSGYHLWWRKNYSDEWKLLF